ncbi:hypothetical protein A5657_19665 [Mycobacterium kubicae]|nr:hypothetical protein A5657_19665 [Mycobacterium kubicae]
MTRGEFLPELLAADLQHGSKLNQLGFVLVGVVLAEQEFSSRRQLGSHPGCGTAAVAAICSS